MNRKLYQRKKMKGWRLAKNDSLTILWTAANAKDATNGDISKYTEAFEEKKLFLLKEKKELQYIARN